MDFNWISIGLYSNTPPSRAHTPGPRYIPPAILDTGSSLCIRGGKGGGSTTFDIRRKGLKQVCTS